MRIPDRPCGIELRENWGHMGAARLSEKIPYGVYRSEKRARTAVLGPSNPTFIIPQLAAFVNRQNKQKFEDFSILEFDALADRQFIIKFHVLTAITAGHIRSGLCPHMGAVRTTLFDFQSQSSSSQGALPKPSKWQRGYSSPSSCQ